MSWGGNSLGKPEFLLDFQVWSKLWNMSYNLALIPNTWDTCFLVLEHKSKVQLQWETYFYNELEIYQTKIYLPQKLPTSGHMHSYTATATYLKQFLDLLHVVWKIINKSVTLKTFFPELSFNSVMSTQFQKLHLDLKTWPLKILRQEDKAQLKQEQSQQITGNMGR